MYFKHNRFREKKKVSERYLEALRGITSTALRYGVSLRREKLPPEYSRFCGQQTAVIAPGARWQTKRWPEEYFASLASKILGRSNDTKIIWLGGRDEEPIFDFLRQHPYLTRHRQRMLFAAGVLSPGQMVELAARSAVSVSNDSGLMHLLSAAPTPLIALFLSTVEEFGFYPLGNAQVLSARNIPCRPCNHKGLPQCPRHHFRCARELTPEMVFAALAEYLGLKAPT
ncbi:MAG: glycosyltransferase family 9 protein, partial [Turneriella sp.]|nr:glycosyltransferase family 9 protein [Turneriella sp.]